jgi:putative SOS response-associated peptidase YedK
MHLPEVELVVVRHNNALRTFAGVASQSYERKKTGKVKQPFLIALKSGDPFTLAGLWENWKEPATGEWIRTFTIVTTDANSLVGELHDRMPVIIAPADRQRWMDPDETPNDLLQPHPADEMTTWPVSTAMNSPKNDTRELIETRSPGKSWRRWGRFGRSARE